MEAEVRDFDNPVDVLRETWPVLTPEERVEHFRRLPPDEAEEFFLALSARSHAIIILGSPAGERRRWMRILPPDDAADVIQEAPPEERPALLGLLTDGVRHEVVALLAYAEDQAGGLMSPRFARVRPEMTVDEAIAYLRRQVRERHETIYYAYVLDANQKLEGVVSLRELFAAPGDRLVRDTMHEDLVTVPEEMDQEAVAQAIARHDLLAVPVVDAEGRMKGIVTVDDVVDVVQIEATEDIQKLGGLEALDSPYLQTGFLSLIRKRAGWLALLFVGGLVTASTMETYQGEIGSAVVLALFLPMIISSGGNSGSQAATLVIRAMALNEVRLRDWIRILRRELAAGLALGAVLALIGLGRVFAWEALFGAHGQHVAVLATTVALSILGVVLWGNVVGSMLPFVLRRLGFDPASASAPFVATLCDVFGLVIYFSIARVLLAGTLL